MLSDTPRQKLAALIALDGVKVASDAKLCEALLRDYCGEYRVEIAALTAAVRWGIPKSLTEHGLTPPATLRANLARRLQENHGLAEESSFWAVDAWASILSQTAGGSKPDLVLNETWSMPAGPVSPSPSGNAPYQPPSPPLPPLPKEPSGPQAPPPPRPAYQAQSPVLPPLPTPLSSPPVSPPPKPLYVPPPLPQQPISFAAAARDFETQQSTAQLVEAQTYLKTELKTRNRQALLEELRDAGVPPVTAKRMVTEQMRSLATQHFGIAVAVCGGSIMVLLGSVLFHMGLNEFGYLLCGGAFLYLTYRGLRLIATL